ncbi:hypothetical protein ACJ6WJ_02545 [Stenotrophomonas maltophilia]|uniref:hypothetical protein n=1 Tax=Stenotrophomonas maltophilia TaxID=40324 RepID=UPI00389687AF
MNTDNKTLADAQPGGRVRLGDALLPCPFCGAPAERIDFGVGSGENEGGSCIACTVCQHSGPIEFGFKENFVSNWNRRARPAQPSPGGQGDGVRCSKCKDRGYLDVDVDVDDSGSSIGNIEACPHCALAARQPVGEPVTVEAVATVRRTSDGDRYIDWLTEGGIADLEVGDVLMVSDRAITDEDGSGEVYTAPPAQTVDLGTGVKAIAAERERQLQAEGFSRICDQQYREGELARAATAYVQLAAMDLQVGSRKHIASQEPPFFWPWAQEWWKPVDARSDLVRAGAMIAAQIDLIDGQAVGNG